MKKVFVRQGDYELYSIPLPLRSLSRRNGRNFLLKELEKRHPCFSSANCFDTKVTLKKRSVFADVVVMEKAKLFEYRSAFPSQNLFLEGCANRCVFRKKGDIAKFAAAGVLVAGIVFGIHATAGERAVAAHVETGGFPIARQVERTEEEYVFLAPQELFMLVFASVGKNGGKINSMEWSGSTCVFDVSGCPSEEIAGAKYCQVSYRNGEPNFTIHNDGMKIRRAERAEYDAIFNGGLLSVGDSADSVWTYGDAPLGKEFVPSVRSGLLSVGCAILGEQVTKDACMISFLCDEKNFSRALELLASASRVHGLSEKSIRIENGAQYATVRVSFLNGAESQNDVPASPLSVCARYAGVLCHSRPLPAVETHRQEKKSEAVYTISPHRRDAQINRLGSIVAKDGRVFAYYKSNDGKIKMEEERAQ